ncbi:MAG: urease subunit gamma [Flavobacteriales bacterium AspAUS03]
MYLTQYKKRKLLLHLEVEVEQKHLNQRIKLNHPKCINLITHYVMKSAREDKTVAQFMEKSSHLLKINQIMDGVPKLLNEVQEEGTFPDGTKFVTVHNAVERKSEIIPEGVTN